MAPQRGFVKLQDSLVTRARARKSRCGQPIAHFARTGGMAWCSSLFPDGSVEFWQVSRFSHSSDVQDRHQVPVLPAAALLLPALSRCPQDRRRPPPRLLPPRHLLARRRASPRPQRQTSPRPLRHHSQRALPRNRLGLPRPVAARSHQRDLSSRQGTAPRRRCFKMGASLSLAGGCWDREARRPCLPRLPWLSCTTPRPATSARPAPWPKPGSTTPQRCSRTGRY